MILIKFDIFRNYYFSLLVSNNDNLLYIIYDLS